MILASPGVLGIKKLKDGSYVWKSTGKKVKFMSIRDLHAYHQSEPIFVADHWKYELEEEKMRIENMKPKPKTYHEGANDERTAILAKVRRMIEARKLENINAALKRKSKLKYTWHQELSYLETWLLQRNERYKKRNGGL